MAKIGIVGAAGVVGSALVYGFEKLGHQVFKHDLRFGTKLEEVLESETVFVCVPTPARPDGSCNTEIVESVVTDLVTLKFDGIIAIKSTVEPGFTDKMIQKFNNEKICFCPEFLTERNSFSDFIEKHDLLVVGTRDASVFLKIKEQHGKYPKTVVQLSPTESELCKYYNNVYNATLVTFANSFYEICKKLGADYSKVKDAVVNRDHITDIYLDCNDNFRGFGGMCLPKDTKALNHLAKTLETNVRFFDNLLTENAKYKITVIPGMRPEQ